MPALNFKKEFADLVQSGKKLQTIRAPRKRKWVVGDRLYLYTGMRTSECRKLGEATLANLHEIMITSNGWVVIDDATVTKSNSFARADGFQSHTQMIDFFRTTHGLPFHCHLLKWERIETQKGE